MQLIGAYAAPMRSDEAVVIWAARDFRQLCAVYAGVKRKAALQQWAARASALERERQVMWLVPSPHCFFYPGSGA